MVAREIHILIFRSILDAERVLAGREFGFNLVGHTPIVPICYAAMWHYDRTYLIAVD